jgi:hypothetical protein
MIRSFVLTEYCFVKAFQGSPGVGLGTSVLPSAAHPGRELTGRGKLFAYSPLWQQRRFESMDSSPDCCVLGGENAFLIVKATIARWPQVKKSEARYLGSWTAAKYKEIRSGSTRRVRVHEPKSPGKKHTTNRDRISRLLVIRYSRRWRFTSEWQLLTQLRLDFDTCGCTFP